MKEITGNCDVCDSPIRPAKTQQQFNRNLGLHKFKHHGLRGSSHSVQYKLRKESGRERLLKSDARRRELAMPETPIQVSLPTCPCCGARFYAVKGGAA